MLQLTCHNLSLASQCGLCTFKTGSSRPVFEQKSDKSDRSTGAGQSATLVQTAAERLLPVKNHQKAVEKNAALFYPICYFLPPSSVNFPPVGGR
jgi:hypothetical protein